MKCGLSLGTALFLSVCAPPTWAQQPSNSFSALPQILKIGQEVIVRPERGGAVQGDVVSISENEIVVRPRTGFNVTEHRFAKDMVRGIDKADSDWDGALKGAAAGLGVVLALSASTSLQDPTESALVYPVGALLFVLPGVLAGYGIDSMWHETLYERPRQLLSRVTMAPMIRRDQLGTMARIRF